MAITPNVHVPWKQKWQTLQRLSDPYHRVLRLAMVNDWRNVRAALGIAYFLHDGQTRRSGEPFIYHPLRVALTLYTLGVRDDRILAAALLHDVIEDCADRMNKKILTRLYSLDGRIMPIVRLLTKQTDRPDNGTYFSGISRSPEALLIKLADRLDNLSTVRGAFSQERLRAYVLETEVFVLPLCDLGLMRFPERRAIIHAMAQSLAARLNAARWELRRIA